MFSLSKIKQLNLFEQISELNHLSSKQPVGFLKLLSENFDLESFVPESFSNHYYATLGRDRDYKLTSILSALILMQIFHIPTNILLPDLRTVNNHIITNIYFKKKFNLKIIKNHQF